MYNIHSFVHREHHPGDNHLTQHQHRANNHRQVVIHHPCRCLNSNNNRNLSIISLSNNQVDIRLHHRLVLVIKGHHTRIHNDIQHRLDRNKGLIIGHLIHHTRLVLTFTFIL